MSVAVDAPILVVDDDRRTSELVSVYLRRQGYRTVSAYGATEALSLAETSPPRLAILDIMLPDLDGWELCRRFRSRSSFPIVLISALGEEQDRMKGFASGADDYVVKPFSFHELVARVNAILRRAAHDFPALRNRLCRGGLEVDVEKRRASLDGKTLGLTKSEFRLLEALMTSPGRVFPRKELLLHLYPDGGIVVDRVVDVHIGNLRQKVERDAAHPSLLLTARGMGYYFCDDAPR